MTHIARYIIVLDRYDDDDNAKSGTLPASDLEGIQQVAAELQEAMEESGVPAGFFRVVARTVLDANDNATAHDTPDEYAHAAAMNALDKTRTY
jgi:hypothetical protein